MGCSRPSLRRQPWEEGVKTDPTGFKRYNRQNMSD